MNPDSRSYRFAQKSLWMLVKALCSTLRFRTANDAGLIEARRNGKPVIIAFWHGLMLPGWFRHRPQDGHRMAALVSQSSDGALLASTLEHLGFSLIRGSSHMGGKEAMALMEQAVREGASLCITPDGPTGPPNVMKMGAVRLAQKTSTPLVLAGIAVRGKKLLRSWDSFEIPLPFTRVDLIYSNAMMIDAGMDLEEVRRNAETRLRELTQQAQQRMAGRS